MVFTTLVIAENNSALSYVTILSFSRCGLKVESVLRPLPPIL